MATQVINEEVVMVPQMINGEAVMAPQVPETAETAELTGPSIFAELEASKAQNPNAHNFDNIVTPEEVEQSHMADNPHLAVSLSEMLGGHGQEIERKGIVFYPQSPALEDLDELMEATFAMSQEGQKLGAGLVRIASYILYVADAQAEGGERRATLAEVGRCFRMVDFPLLQQIIQKNANMDLLEATPSPNAASAAA